jgi:hypothetical protein
MTTLLLAALFGCPAPAAAPVGETMSKPATCLATWSMGKGASVLSEQRSLPGQDWFDFATGYEAAAIDATHVPVKATARFTVDGAPVLYFTADGAQAIVDARVFSALTAVDATGITAGTTATVGVLQPGARGKLTSRDVVEFLVRADAIRTWAHIGSELCLVAESESDPAFTAEFTGEHVYFTNQENHGRLAFVVTIAGDGTVTVTGR